MNWYIGQDIVAIEDCKLFFKEGDTFQVKALKKTNCKCDFVVISIGVTYPNKYKATCSLCNSTVDGAAG